MVFTEYDTIGASIGQGGKSEIKHVKITDADGKRNFAEELASYEQQIEQYNGDWNKCKNWLIRQWAYRKIYTIYNTNSLSEAQQLEVLNEIEQWYENRNIPIKKKQKKWVEERRDLFES